MSVSMPKAAATRRSQSQQPVVNRRLHRSIFCDAVHLGPGLRGWFPLFAFGRAVVNLCKPANPNLSALVEATS